MPPRDEPVRPDPDETAAPNGKGPDGAKTDSMSQPGGAAKDTDDPPTWILELVEVHRNEIKRVLSEYGVTDDATIMESITGTLSRQASRRGWESADDVNHPERWIKKIARYRAMDNAARKKAGPIDDVDPVDDLPSPEEAAITRELVEKVLEEVALLDPNDRSIVVLRYLKEESYPAIASHLRIDGTTARKRLSRALQKLRNALPSELF
jgi:RNA polymerase sigma factor (sigma-70 family)